MTTELLTSSALIDEGGPSGTTQCEIRGHTVIGELADNSMFFGLHRRNNDTVCVYMRVLGYSIIKPITYNCQWGDSTCTYIHLCTHYCGDPKLTIIL